MNVIIRGGSGLATCKATSGRKILLQKIFVSLNFTGKNFDALWIAMSCYSAQGPLAGQHSATEGSGGVSTRSQISAAPVKVTRGVPFLLKELCAMFAPGFSTHRPVAFSQMQTQGCMTM
jgi:hypothetical protein